MTLSNRLKRTRGSAVLEFALGWSILGAVFAGGFQFGYTFWVYNSLLTACNGAAQYGSKLGYDTGNTATYTTALKNVVVYGDPSGGSRPIVPGLTASNVSVTVTASASMPLAVTVSITSFAVNSVFQTYTFNGKPRVTMAYSGQVSCASC